MTTALQATGTLRVTYLDIVIRRHDDKMVQLAQEEFKVEEFSWSAHPYFGQRWRIAKQVYEEKLTEAEKEIVQQELKKVKDQGWDPETQKMYVPCLSVVSRCVPFGPGVSRCVPPDSADLLIDWR
jgi:hypothetical protein